MEVKINAVFCAARSFKSKAGKDCNLVELLEVDSKTNYGKHSTMFVDSMPTLAQSLKFGDTIEVLLAIESAGETPKLRDITKKVSDSPYKFSPVA
ncbi:MAG: hypothetical protein M0R40_11315 [Firmicutes bacterium]|nr:hypothetical protein [Bacillota bacterium]